MIKIIEKIIQDLEIHLTDPTNGIIKKTLNKNYYEEYKEYGLIEAFECTLEEINRINNLIELHDILIQLNEKELKILEDKYDNK